MLARVQMLWVAIRDSLWFVPGLLTLLAVMLAVGVVQAEREGLLLVAEHDHWLLGGGAEGARGMLSAIAGGLITVTGVVFSVTVVVLQLASSQFTPRILRGFMADRSNQVVLGVFIGTFTYALLVQRAVRSPVDDGEEFVPGVAVAIAMVLVLISIVCLIYFINHVARSIQVSVLLDRVARRTLGQVERLFPETVGEPDSREDDLPPLPASGGAAVPSEESGYLRAVDDKALFKLGESKELLIRMEPTIGDFVLCGQPLVRVWPPEGVDEEVVQQIRLAFVLGLERTPDQDAEFGIIEIADIAIKALSPSVNDPTTAIRCIDHLTEILLALGKRQPPADLRTEEGNIHFLARHLTYARAVGLAFDQIRVFGAENPTVAKRMLDALGQLVQLVPEPRRAPLREQMQAVIEEARLSIQNPRDLAGVEEVLERIENGAAPHLERAG